MQAEIDFVVDDVRYHYGFAATPEAFSAEWLFSFPHERRLMLFEREGMRFRFGRNLKGRNHIISELTRSNCLFLSAAAQNGHDELTRVSGFFRASASNRSARPVRAGWRTAWRVGWPTSGFYGYWHRPAPG